MKPDQFVNYDMEVLKVEDIDIEVVVVEFDNGLMMVIMVVFDIESGYS